jgi:two-component system phosphate regulon sensor histidine kinase PhoR
MFAELLQSGRVGNDEKREKYTGIILSESERLTGLIENVLDFAKAERGGVAYELAPADLGEVVSRTVEVCRVRADRDGATVELSVEPDLPLAKLDERAVEIAVTNLIDNALKYGTQGQSVSVEVRRWKKRHLAVVVGDRGPGIPEEERDKIFERFVRADPSGQTRGSGIGLALVQAVARAHGGRVWVEPNEPKGSRFFLTIRL